MESDQGSVGGGVPALRLKNPKSWEEAPALRPVPDDGPFGGTFDLVKLDYEHGLKGQVYEEASPRYAGCECGGTAFAVLQDYCWTGVRCLSCGLAGVIHDG